jgi:hypothetical protein
MIVEHNMNEWNLKHTVDINQLLATMHWWLEGL